MHCRHLDEEFSCLRREVGGCRALGKIVSRLVQERNRDEEWSRQCPSEYMYTAVKPD